MGADLDAGASTSWNAHAYSFVCPGGRLRSGLNQYLITTDTQPLLGCRKIKHLNNTEPCCTSLGVPPFSWKSTTYKIPTAAQVQN